MSLLIISRGSLPFLQCGHPSGHLPYGTGMGEYGLPAQDCEGKGYCNFMGNQTYHIGCVSGNSDLALNMNYGEGLGDGSGFGGAWSDSTWGRDVTEGAGTGEEFRDATSNTSVGYLP